MPKKFHLSLDELKSIVNYDPETGILTWVGTGTGRSKRGGEAGSLKEDNGYLRVTIKGQVYYAHRLIFYWMTGRDPMEYVDHRNGVRSDNRWANLRECSWQENCQNYRRKSPTKHGFLTGVHRKSSGKFGAQISVNRKLVVLGGAFETEEAAHAAYVEAKAKYHAFSPELRH